ncbi:MAG: Gamma-glutamyltranspeptidase @ Glutathione hydrolase [uncultured Thermomicrobiales bacterium]|uniref:Gamma-glutamyltranspeptidase @ Glutathione hydrolase n=1 Tax=uncultured Thermomicrobiales bacterium TaxID=1645740 RepID=A0A6J4UZC2_9BACT|nr:MAG: Gamma-glutamyltranspeptidase @ Glutathione hydrolase [uncultured Thermomicrobiales bacterium]
MATANEQIAATDGQAGRAATAAAEPPRDALMAGRGMVASAHPFATGAGVAMLRDGGNAVDAAVAAAAVLTMVEPRNGHLGGDTFLQISLAQGGGVVAINGSGAAPAAATLERYQRGGGIPEHGLLSSVVPGTVSAWALALDRYGTRSLADALAIAIDYAEQGVPVTPRLHRMLSLDAPVYRRYADSARVFLPGGQPPAVGATFRQPGLAASLRRIADGGRDEFYRGALAGELVAASERYDGLFTRADFAAHETEVAEPIAVTYRGYTVYEQPPPSQGLIVSLALNILQEFDLPSMEPSSVEVTHLLLEALKLAFQDRLRWLGDPRCGEIPLARLLSRDHAREQAARIDRRRAAPLALPRPVQPDTTSLCAADAAGNMVTYIHSLFSGAGVVLGDTGVLMNSRLRGFNLQPGHPNRLAPGKRPAHTLNTYVVHRDGEPLLVGNTPGAHWQVQTNLQILTNVLDFAMDLPQAIAAPRFTLGDQLEVGNPAVKLESRAEERIGAGLRALGHQVEAIGPWASGGAVQLIARDPRNGLYRGATEVRHPGCLVLGF